MLAGKEKREMEALFGKKATAAPSSAPAVAKKFEPTKGGSGASVPSMFRGGAAPGGTLQSAGSSQTMDLSSSAHVSEANRGGFAGPASSGGVSRLNMGSAGIMEKPALTGVRDPVGFLFLFL